MSRHHIMPTTVYAPPPPPKKIEKKRSATVGIFGELDETENMRETGTTGQPMQISSKLLQQNFPEIEGADQKPRQPPGRLSQGTLSVLLRVQEM